MINRLAVCAPFVGAAAALFFLPVPVLAQDSIEGVFALPGAVQAVTGQLGVEETGPLTRRIELTYADQASGEQISGFDVELTQQLHILATDAGLNHLIHEHADVIGADGSFSAELEFPEPGLYHIYTDAVPTGIGQQVMRFDVQIGNSGAAEVEKPIGDDISNGPLVSADGPYSVTLDATQLQAGRESAVSLLVEKDGVPADDLEPYLGVSAHAVLIRAEDLAYVHAHATSGEEGHEAHGAHGAAPPAMPDHAGHAMPAEHSGHDGHDEHGAPAQEGGHSSGDATAPAIDPQMSLHVTPPAPGTYALWIEFIGGGEIRTVPFTVDIPAASQS